MGKDLVWSKKQRDVINSITKCRYLNREHVEAVEQILTERPVSYGRAQIFICRREHSHINPNRLVPTYSFEFVLLENS
jgi:hypothetical protein